MASNPELISADTVDEDALVQAVQSTLARLLERKFEIATIKSVLRDVDPFRSAWDDTLRIINGILEARAPK